MRRLVMLCALIAMGCGAYQRGEGLDTAVVPPNLRDDYDLFARRCSRCHSLSRPLNARVDGAQHWGEYVDRMRRMPGSGISPDEAPALLRFLTWYSAARRSSDGGVGVTR